MELTKEEEIIITSIIVDLSDKKEKISNEDILKELILRSKDRDVLNNIKRTIRKNEKRIQSNNNHSVEYKNGYNDLLNNIKNNY